MTREIFYAPHGFLVTYLCGDFALTVGLYNGAVPE